MKRVPRQNRLENSDERWLQTVTAPGEQDLIILVRRRHCKECPIRVFDVLSMLQSWDRTFRVAEVCFSDSSQFFFVIR